MKEQILRALKALYAYSKISSKENLKDALIEQYDSSLQKTKDFLKEEYNVVNADGFISFFNGFCFSQKERDNYEKTDKRFRCYDGMWHKR